jgi:DNA polymerase V
MREKIFALVDCNNFYCSCERVFNASVRLRPVIVLSNNDGCVVARTNDIKKYIPMGQPVFECREIIEKYHVAVFSSNYSLYADMSARVMTVLRRFSPLVEIYSIDEAFLDVTEVGTRDFTQLGRAIRARVLQETGIPVSVGFAKSKTLSKIATELVKKDHRYEGVLDLTSLSEDALDELLSKIEVEDVWGIGSQYAKFLQRRNILTAKDLKYADPPSIRKHLTVVGERTVLELRGISCLPLEEEVKDKKGIMCAKTFGREITSREELEEAIANYIARAAEKLRSQESQAACMSVFIQTNVFKKRLPQYANSITTVLPYPTAFTPDLIQAALQAVRLLYKEGYRYRKAGVYLTKIIPEEVVQPDLFGDFSFGAHEKKGRLMAIVDAINSIYGRDTLFFAVQGITRPWKMRQSLLSSRFTTQWSELLTIGDHAPSPVSSP